jgi:hypothetical protein
VLGYSSGVALSSSTAGAREIDTTRSRDDPRGAMPGYSAATGSASGSRAAAASREPIESNTE